jgi:hypothetical protein
MDNFESNIHLNMYPRYCIKLLLVVFEHVLQKFIPLLSRFGQNNLIYYVNYFTEVVPSPLLLKPLIVLPYQPWLIVGDEYGALGGMNEMKVLRGKPPQCRFCTASPT